MSETYRYRIRSTGYSSRRYGPCQVCGRHASEVFLQAELQMSIRPDGSVGYSHRGTIFGHRECLERIRKTPYDIVMEAER